MMTMPRRRAASLPCCLTDNAIRLRCLRGELLDRPVPVERRLVVPVNALLLPWQIGQRPRHLLVHADTRPGNLVARVATPLDHPGGAEMGRCRCLARLAVRIAVDRKSTRLNSSH